MIPPLVMPTVGTLRTNMEPQRVDYGAPEASGRLGGVSAGSPLWLLELDLQNMLNDTLEQWRAWRARLRGQQRLFYGYERGHEYPRLYRSGFGGMTRAGGGAFTGGALSWSETLDANNESNITLTGMPAGIIIAIGDYIGFKWDGAGEPAGSHRRRALVRVVQGGVANGGGSVTPICEPPVPLVVPPSAVAHLDNPCCLMRLMPETQLPPMGIGIARAGGRIVGLQDLVP